MRSIYVLTLMTTLFNAQSGMAKFEAHEWGTFTSLVGSNGVTQHGMYHEDEALPDFVHGFGETLAGQPAPPPNLPPSPPRPPCRGKICFGDEFFARNLITQKMETPVIYFYSDQQRTVDVNVRFPEGVVTDTYPAPIVTSPTTGDIREVKNGNTTFRLEVLNEKTGMVPLVPSGNIYGHARNVDSNIVRSGAEREKFLFYRGIGRFQPRIDIRSEGGGLTLTAREPKDRPQAMYLVHVSKNGLSQMMRLTFLKDRADVSREEIFDLKTPGFKPDHILRGSQQREALVASLVQSGLKTDEATAMVDTWEHGYLKVPGLRLLYILPRAEVDEVLPLTLTPAPDQLERVFVGRIEVLLDTEEKAILERVLREQGYFQVSSLGRFAEPMLRRVLEVYRAGENAPANVSLLERLIQKAATVEGI